ncbi:MAG TPA: GNAT family N-acetyltransferase [Steroidobacteraceae bacterium]|nr:GNAT family N-acetyltransferase [Steroidobacteraceae bacterium]
MTQPAAPSPVIRRATVDDAAALSKIAAETFVETFGHLYPPEDLQAYLATSYAAERSRKQLADQAIGIWFAMLGEEPAGFIVAGGCKLPVQNLEPTAGEIRQLYVYAKHQNLRIGSRLLDTALDWLVTSGRDPLYVGVWSENYGAQRLYARYGFVKCGEYGFPVGKTVDLEFILKRARA